MKNIAIIPARGGSKRIPRKNIKLFLGKPMISYAIKSAIKSGLFENIIVSTDDEEIAEISRNYGAIVPFMRSTENSNDFATTDEVLDEVITNLINNNLRFDYFCCIYPTSPLLKTSNLKKSYNKMIHDKMDGIFSVTNFSYPIYRGLTIEDGYAKMIWPENKQKRSQDLPIVFHDAGQFYWSTKDAYLKKKTLWTEKTGVFKLSNLEVQDIDNETDWIIAEQKYKILHEK